MTPHLEELLKSTPPFLNLPNGRVYFTLAAWDGGWQACYCADGLAERFLHEFGGTPEEAVQKVIVNLNLVEMLR